MSYNLGVFLFDISEKERNRDKGFFLNLEHLFKKNRCFDIEESLLVD
jgi:hypothetical protein